MDEEEWLKSNTDCVYFLATPPTCNKGIECEFRHCEIARLNPRECRYWSSGNCLNPHCAFRHSYQQTAAAPVNKLNVPCYFFFNGFCNKGQSCLFLHEFDSANWELKRTVQAINVQLDVAMGNDTSLIPLTKTCANPSAFVTSPIDDRKIRMENTLKFADSLLTRNSPLENYPGVELSEKNNLSALQDVAGHSPNQQSSEPLFKEDKISKLDFPLPAKELTKKTSYASSEQSSDDRAGSGTKQKERESSPSFDVQVNEYDADGFTCKFDEVNGGMYENEEYQSYDNFKSPSICANRSPSHVRNRELDFLHSQRWSSLRSRRSSSNEDLRDRLKKKTSLGSKRAPDTEDLRDYLNKRRLMNDNFSSSTSFLNEEIHQNPIINTPGRLSSQVVITDVGSHVERQSFKKSSTQQKIPRLTRKNGPGQHFRRRRSGRKQQLDSEKPFDEYCERRESSGEAGKEDFCGPEVKRMLRSEVSIL